MFGGEKMNHMTVLRKKAGYNSAHDAAKAIGCCYGTIYAIESTGKHCRKPSPMLANKITKVYNCTFEEIFLPYLPTDSCN